MNRVVVTGMGIISPIGNNVEEFWNGLKSGKNGIGYITKIDTENLDIKIAAEVKDFDATAYMKKAEARKMDMFTQYGIAAAVQAMEQSGLSTAEDGNIEAGRLGVYFGSGIGGIQTFVAEQTKVGEKGPNKVSPFFIPMMISNMCAGQIAIRFGAKGSALPMVTACATSNNTIGEAYRAIKHGYADAIIAGGSEAAITPISVAGFANMKALSTKNDPETACCPFDVDRDGFIMGEGAGAVVLESLDHALARGANILAEVVGYGSTCDAHHITAPDPTGEGGAEAMRLALAEANMPDEDKIYINAHGTSTPLNDAGETKVIKLALGEERAKKAIVSSTKSMTGHMLGAAGAAEAIASVLALQNQTVPPTIHLNNQAPECDLDCCPNVARETEINLALSNGLGFGGHNACIALKRYN
ncbi:MAG: beta-ketoacyl-ACP synthase II [Clostridia bacterium]|nr:beta-ketoacyl-ACP synthase II [Clostridia bacterium]